VIVYALLWLAFDRSTLDWNAIATLAVFVMTLFIQRANRRDTLALQAKLDELLRVDHATRSELTQLDEQEPEAIARHRDEEVPKANRETKYHSLTTHVCSLGCLKFPHQHQSFSGNERGLYGLFRIISCLTEIPRANSCRLRHRLSMLPGNPNGPDAQH
jgi:low affinity Fe/Cu permease